MVTSVMCRMEGAMCNTCNVHRKILAYTMLLQLTVFLIVYLCMACCSLKWFNLLQGPFATFKLQQDKECDWTSLKFSPDGKLILISTNGQVLRVIDAFQGSPLHTFKVPIKVFCVCNFGYYVDFLHITKPYYLPFFRYYVFACRVSRTTGVCPWKLRSVPIPALCSVVNH